MGLEISFDAIVASFADALGSLGAAVPAAADAGAAAGLGAADAAGVGSAFGGIASDAALGYGAGAAGLGAADLGAGLGAAGSAFGGIASDAAGGATIAEGVPLASTYGPVSAFATDAGLTAGPASTFAEGLSPATGGTLSGPIDTGAFTASAPASGITATAPVDTTALASTPTSTTGLTASAPGATTPSIGSGVPLAPGPGAPALAPPPSTLATTLDPTAAASLSPTDTANLSAFQVGNVPGDNAIGLDATNALPSTGQVQAAGDGGFSEGLSPATSGTLDGPIDSGVFTTPTPTGLAGVGHAIGGALNDAGTFLNSPAGKLAGTGIAGVGLVNSLLSARNPNPIPGEAQLAQLATQLGQTGSSLVQSNAPAESAVAGGAVSQAQTLENYLNTGTLPAPVQDALNRATQSAITKIKASYAARGEPPGSSAEEQDIAAAQQNAVINGGSLAASLYSQGVSQEQLAAQIYGQLTGEGISAAGAGAGAQESVVGTNTAINNGLNSAIGNLATALGGGTHLIVNGSTVTQ